MKKRRWPWVVAALVLVAGAVGSSIYYHHRTVLAEAAAKIEMFTVRRGDVEQSVDSACKVSANLEVEIKCRASGPVVSLPFDISQNVKAGDLLCQLDKTDEQLAVKLAEATLEQASAKVDQARENLETAQESLITTRERDQSTLESAKVKAANLRAKADRQKELIAQELGSKEDLETAQTDAAAAAADQRSAEIALLELKQQEIQIEFKKKDVKTAEAAELADQISLDTARQQLAYTTVTSPIDGTVSALSVQIGTQIESGNTAANGGTSILTLSDLSHIFVLATVDESDIGDVQVGQDARITVESFPKKVFPGKVVRVPVKGVNTSNVVTFEVKVEVLGPERSLLKPEMTGSVTIVQKQRKNVIVVPVGAVNHRATDTVVLADGQNRTVTLGLQGEEMVEVTSGLSEGEKIQANGGQPSTKWQNDGHGGPPR